MLSKLKYILLLFLILVPCAGLFTLALLYSQNNLFYNNEWIVQKRMPAISLMGSVEYIILRAAIAQGHLDLGAYYGHQEVTHRTQTDTQKLELEFKIPENSYLDILFNRQDSVTDGLRISRNANYPSMSFTEDKDHRFISKEPIDLKNPTKEWHQLKITKIGKKLKVELNQETQFVSVDLKQGQISFRSGFAGAVVKNIYIYTPEKIHKISFFNTKYGLNIFIVSLLVAFFLGLMALIPISLSRQWTKRKFVIAWIAFSFIGTEFVGTWLAFDYLYYSKLLVSPVALSKVLGREVIPQKWYDLEVKRYYIFQEIYHWFGGEKVSRDQFALRGYPSAPICTGPIFCASSSKDCKFIESPAEFKESSQKNLAYRVIFLGTSQTAGCGAETIDKSFFASIHHQLKSILPKTIQLDSINHSICGGVSKELVEVYKKYYLDMKPDLVVVNLSNNDLGRTEFAPSINEILKLNKNAYIKTILIEEANNAERLQPFNLLSQHEVLRQIGAEYNIKPLALHSYLNDPLVYKQGFLWWDGVHLTNFGHFLIAEWLTPKIYQTLTSVKPKSRPAINAN